MANRNCALVVDDVEINLIVASELLKQHGLTVDAVDNGRSAVDKIKSGCVYDIIFMDLFMPGLNGIEAAEDIRELGYNGKIVMLTGDVSLEDTSKREDIRYLFDGYLHKPIDVSKLREVLEELLGKNYNGGENLNSAIEKRKYSASYESRISRAFTHDASNAVGALRNGENRKNIKNLTSVFHAVKSALANIGEEEIYHIASNLESAGIRDDMNYINERVGDFIKTLESLIKKYGGNLNIKDENNSDVQTEDKELIALRLRDIKMYCDNYQMQEAYSALVELLDGSLKSDTRAFVSGIRDILYSDSDFEGSSEKIGEFLQGYAVS